MLAASGLIHRFLASVNAGRHTKMTVDAVIKKMIIFDGTEIRVGYQ